ncbi:MAG TPA: cation:proton antiporter, partial [Methanomicrobiales archaeon]|nr:cation:proton antiporter [Methanomicrobiales archaeon]
MDGIALVLLVALILAYISRRFSISPIPFYIIVGLILGESGLQLVRSGEISEYLSFLGLLFLLFYVGLELKPARLAGKRASMLTSGLIDLNVNLLVGFFASLLLGFTPVEAFVVGSAFYISSSAMAVASLVENRKLILPEAETVVWMMIFEDILLILLLSAISIDMQNPLILLLSLVA